MSVILLVAAIFSTLICSVITGLVYSKKHEGEQDSDVEATFGAMIVALIVQFIWLSVFAIVFRNSIHI